jgi:hypothetical protein
VTLQQIHHRDSPDHAAHYHILGIYVVHLISDPTDEVFIGAWELPTISVAERLRHQDAIPIAAMLLLNKSPHYYSRLFYRVRTDSDATYVSIYTCI